MTNTMHVMNRVNPIYILSKKCVTIEPNVSYFFFRSSHLFIHTLTLLCVFGSTMIFVSFDIMHILITISTVIQSQSS